MKNRYPKQPPIDNRRVAPGCEPFASKPLTRRQAEHIAITEGIKRARLWYTATPRVPMCSDMALLRNKPKGKRTVPVLVIPLNIADETRPSNKGQSPER